MEEVSRIRVVVINTSPFEQAALLRLIEADPQLEVSEVVTALSDGLRSVSDHDPDVVLLALTRYENEGLSLLQRLISRFPRAVVALLPLHADLSLHVRALEAGAAQTLEWEIRESATNLLAFQALLASKLKAFGAAYANPQAAALLAQESHEAQHPADSAAQPSSESRSGDLDSLEDDGEIETLQEPVYSLEAPGASAHKPRNPLERMHSSGLIHPRRLLETGARDPDRRAEVVVLGGGACTPALLRHIITRLPPSLNLALLAVVRLSAPLLELYCERLDRDSAIRVAIAQEGDPVRPGQLLLAPADRNMGMVRTGRIPKALIRLMQPDAGIGATPALDVTLRASAAIYGNGATGVVLSGLSRDGVAGAQSVKARGGLMATLDLKNALVPATNLACIEAQVVDEQLDLLGVVTLITRLGLNL